jgi:hypothetical protein
VLNNLLLNRRILMKKLILVVLSSVYMADALAYKWTIQNISEDNLKVTLNNIGLANTEVNVPASVRVSGTDTVQLGKVSVNTGIACTRSVEVQGPNGHSGEIDNPNQNKCEGHNIVILGRLFNIPGIGPVKRGGGYRVIVQRE